MKQYLQILKAVSEHGFHENGDYVIPSAIIQHHFSTGFPILTTRRLDYKAEVERVQAEILQSMAIGIDNFGYSQSMDHYYFRIGEQLNLQVSLFHTDFFRDVPKALVYNAIMLLALCRECKLIPGMLTISCSKVCVKGEDLQSIRQQLMRKPKDLPDFGFTNWENIHEWEPNIQNYTCFPTL